MPFCPNCKYEYKPGIAKCPDCGSALVERLEEEPPLRPESPLVKLAEGMRPMVEMLADILRQHRIHSMVKAAGPAWTLEWPTVSVQAEVWIRSDDLEQNKALLREQAQRLGDHIIWFCSLGE